MKCDRCGVESGQEAFFHIVPQSFRKQRLRLCPSCAARHREKEYAGALWFVLGLFGAMLVLCWLAPNTKLGPVAGNFGFLLVFMFGSTVMHELGHVFFGRLAGMQILGIEIGRGPVLAEFHLWGFHWQFRAVPLGGFTLPVTQGGAWVRLRQTVFILGGPLANILLILVALAMTEPKHLLPHDFMERFSPGSMLLIANAMFAIDNLIPHRMNTSRGELPSDGMQLWRTWRRSPEVIEVSAPYSDAAKSQDFLSQGKNVEAIVVLWDGSKEYSDDISQEQARACSLLLEGKGAEARRICTKLLGRYSKFEQLRYAMFNNIAYADLLIGDPALLWEADAGSRLALDAQPSVAPFKGTRGAVLVELGDLDAGLRLLEDAMRENEDDRNKAVNACCIGIAHARRGDAEQCRSYFALARRLDPECVWLKREPKLADSGPGSS